MALVLRLVETRTDSMTRSVDVLEINRPSDLCDIATLGLTLHEAKQLLAGVQQAVVAAQARDHAALWLECSSCGARCHVKDCRSRQVATLFGKVGCGYPASSARAAVAARRGSAGPRTAARHRSWISCKPICPRS